MSVERFDLNGVNITTFAGPETPVPQHRRHVQISVGGRHIQMNVMEWVTLYRGMLLLGPTMDGETLWSDVGRYET